MNVINPFGDPATKYGTQVISETELEIMDTEGTVRDGTVVRFMCPEFTCLCPRSGFPDFARVFITYVPKGRIVELKSLKLWLNGFRQKAIFHEALAGYVLDVLWQALTPRYMRVVCDWNLRGNVKTVTECHYVGLGYSEEHDADLAARLRGL